MFDCVCAVWELTENWNWLPVVERMVIAPSSDSETVPDVYVVWRVRDPARWPSASRAEPSATWRTGTPAPWWSGS